MFGRFRVLVSVSAAFPISPTDGEVVYNFRGTLDTANFLGQLFRTFSDVLNLGNRQEEQIAASTSRRSGKPQLIWQIVLVLDPLLADSQQILSKIQSFFW